MSIQWYPGHMAKTRKIIQENMKLVDIVIELVDARLPRSSRNPDIDALLGNKPRILVMNKCDIADPDLNESWAEWYASHNIAVVLVDSISGKGLNQIGPLSRELLKEKIERDRQKGIVNRAVKAMVVGIPNVGKSSFINKFSGRASAKTGDRPGVTRGKQWIRIRNGFELLDTPGILWPKFEDEEVGRKLAYTGAIKDEIINTEELACNLLVFLRDNYPDKLMERYKLDSVKEKEGFELLHAVGKKRGCIVSGGDVDTFRASAILLDEFRGAKIGRITLEKPE
ncbi:MAG: ribosome biogenesis GTPase YlqF [Clostridiaceae bacterium]|nr:ribosome biogenesis GTPase YlqF [Clostridiaceae bacterium]